MSLLDAVLPEPYRDPREIWVALRADGSRPTSVQLPRQYRTTSADESKTPLSFVYEFMKTIPLKPFSRWPVSRGALWLATAHLILNPSVCNCAETIRVPEDGRGDTWSQIPFSGVATIDVPPMRFQQVYDSSGFVEMIPQGAWISGIWFVSDHEVGRTWGASLPKVEIFMGLSDRGADNLSATFAENFSIAPVSVRPLGPLLLSSGGAGFVVQIPFSEPFFYNPSEGNLLLEIKNYEPTMFPGTPIANAGPLDAWNVAGDSISRVYARGDANATVGAVDTIGLTTLFMVTPVPEPSAFALLGLCATAM